MAKKFQDKIDIYPSVKAYKKELTESVVTELIEDLCENDKNYDGAGVKVIKGSFYFRNYKRLINIKLRKRHMRVDQKESQ